MIKRYAMSLFLTGLILLGVGLWLATPSPVVQAQETVADAAGGDAYCAVCHTETTTQVHTFANGNSRPISVDQSVLANSVHGTDNPEGALSCTDCHGEDAFPHDDLPAANQREYRITQSNACIDCHTDQAENLADDVHVEALYDGNLRSATCVDCHGAHNVQPTGLIPIVEAQTCGTCHQIAYSEYSASVHGEALFNGDTNVPTCVDCHGVHGIQHPTTALFRNRSPELCRDCHADEDLMEEYGISTNVFNSYLSDFHGTTVQLFEQSDPNVATNKAVCYDCHGVHDILSITDENSNVIQDNLLATCRECHPDATSDFPDSWVGHYEPTFESHPFLTMVNWFYMILIPLVLGGFIFFVATDMFRMIRERLSGED